MTRSDGAGPVLSRGKYQALQVPGAVVLLAEAALPSRHFKLWIEEDREISVPPRFRVLQQHMAEEAEDEPTHYLAWAHAAAVSPVPRIMVCDRDGLQEVAVTPAFDLFEEGAFPPNGRGDDPEPWSMAEDSVAAPFRAKHDQLFPFKPGNTRLPMWVMALLLAPAGRKRL